MFNEDQPREPAGSPEGGQWSSFDARAGMLNAASDKKRKKVEWPEDHPIIPPIVADSVSGGDHGLSLYLEERAYTHYRESEQFRKVMNGRGNTGRDALYAFMEMWAKTYKPKYY